MKFSVSVVVAAALTLSLQCVYAIPMPMARHIHILSDQTPDGKPCNMTSHRTHHHSVSSFKPPTPEATPAANIGFSPDSDSDSDSDNGDDSGSSSQSQPQSSSSSSSGGNADQAAYLDPHNAIRAKKGAAPLTWSDSLASIAQNWANRCVFEHSQGQTGENLSAGTGSFSVADGIKLWTDEEKDYDPSNPQYSHYTQVVWKGSTELGCAVASCPGMLGGGGDAANFYVCEYNPPGNVIGEFAQNVEA